jgi:nicotinamide riboside kinase
LKIAFIGSHGVGKTTLCYDLAGILKKHMSSVGIVMEVARSCPLPINRDTTLSAQSWILHTQIAREIVETDQNQAVVCDRAALDNYAYMVSATGGHPVLDDLVTYWMGTYDYLFKVPITFSLLRDGIRDVDLEFQKKIDTIVGRLLDEKRIPYYRLPSRGRSSWMTYVQRVLELPLPGSRSRTRQQEPSAHQMKLPMKGD